MKFPAAKFGRDFDAVDDFEQRPGGEPRRRDAGQRVVIGNRKRREPAAPCEIDNLRRRVGAVAESRVQVQIHATKMLGSSQRLTKLREGLAVGHSQESGVRRQELEQFGFSLIQ